MQQTQPEKRYDGLVRKRQSKKRWQQIVSTLVCIVVFCTTYALILPAITISAEVTCGLEAHIHTDACYEQVTVSSYVCDPVHVHSDSCYDGEGNVLCGWSDRVVHSHDGSCYDSEGTLICPLEELEIHTHGEGCYDAEGSLSCQLTETVLHSHGQECLDENGLLICGMLQLEVHTHSAACVETTVTQGDLICAQEEHEHTEECYENFPTELRSALMLMSTGTDDDTGGSKSILEVDSEIDMSWSDLVYNPSTDSFDLRLRLDWSLQGSDLVAYDAFHLTLPEGVIIPDDLLGEDKKGSATDTNKGGAVAFDYWFEKFQDSEGNDVYKIHMEYREDYKTLFEEGDTVSNFIEFTGSIGEDKITDNGGSLELEWENGKTVTIPIEPENYPTADETVHYDIHTTKTVQYDSVNGKLIYTVVVSSTKGTPDPITIEDVLTPNGVTTLSLPMDKLVIQRQDGTTLTSGTDYTANADNDKLTITDLPALAAGESYTLTYEVSITPPTAGQTFYPYNKVTATAESGSEKVESSAATSTVVSKEMVKKTGTYDAENNQIVWTIVVNPDGDDIAGYTLTDQMLQQAAWVNVAVSNAWGGVDADGTYQVDLSTSSILFGPSDGDNTNTYTITYATKQDPTTANNSISNTAVLKDPDGNELPGNNGTAGVTVPSGGGINKTGVLDKGNNVINWEVSVTTPAGGIGAGTVITDHTGYSWQVAQNHWMTQQQIYQLNETLAALFPGVDYTLEFSTDNWNWYKFSDAFADTNTTKYYCWRITFNEDVPNTANTTVSIPYSTTVALTNADTFINYVNMGSHWQEVKVEYKPAVSKLDRYFNSGTTYINSTDGVIGWYVKIISDGTLSEMKLVDTIPAGVTLTKLGINNNGSTYNVDVAASGNVSNNYDLQGVYTYVTNDDGTQTVNMTITHSTNGQYLPEGDIYVYFECQMDKLPEPGNSLTETFTNNATVDDVPVSQTQIVTVNRPKTVTKTDGNSSEADTTVTYSEDGTSLHWYVKVYFDSATNETVVITDTLPEGLTLVKLGIDQYAWNARYGGNCTTDVTTEASGEQIGTNNSYNATYSINNREVTVTLPNGVNHSGYVHLYLECTVNDGVTWEDGDNDTQKIAFANSASVTKGGDPYGNDTHTQTVVKTEMTAEDNNVEKYAVWQQGINQLQYAVVINPGGERLNSGNDLTVTDTMSYQYSPWWHQVEAILISSSVKLYYAEANDSGGYTLKGEVPTSEWSWSYSDNFSDIKSSGGNAENTITAEVPDGVCMVLAYIYEIKVSKFGEEYYDTTNFEINNNVVVKGDEDHSDSVQSYEEYKVSDVIAGATSNGTYTVHKVETGNYNAVLPGAVFGIYTFVDDQPLVVDGSPVTYTTDENGEIRVSWDEDIFSYDVVYYIMETKAPEGYALPETPTEFYFYFVGDAEGSYTIPAGATNLSESFGVAYVTNDPPESYELTVNKTWLDSEGDLLTDGIPEKIWFLLYQTNAHGETVLYSTELYEITAENDWKTVLSDLPLTDSDGNAYTYSVKEVDPNGYTAAVTVDNTGKLTFGEWKDGNGTTKTVDREEINFLLYQNGTLYGGRYYTVTESGGWTLTVPDLPVVDSDGQMYTYEAYEIDMDGYISEVTQDGEGNLTITNRQEAQSELTVKKEWHDIPSEEQKEVPIQLYQSIDTLFTKYTAFLGFVCEDEDVYLGSNTLVKFSTDITGAGTYTIRWDMSNFGFTDITEFEAFFIDIVDPNYALKGYTISELSIVTDQGTYPVNDKFNYSITQYGGGYDRINFYNTYDDTLHMDQLLQISADGYLEVTFTLNAPANDPNNGVLPDLYEYVPSANTGGVAYGDPVMLNSTNSWKYTWRNLPLYGTDANGNTVFYSYYVVETSSDYDVVYSNQFAMDEGTITVNNYPKTTADLTVNKSWKDDNGNSIDPPVDSIEYKLEQLELYTVKIYRGGWGWANEEVMYVRPGTKITIEFIGAAIVEESNYTVVSKEYYGTLLDANNSNAQINLYKYKLERTITSEFTTIGLSYGGYKGDGSWPGYDIGEYSWYKGTFSYSYTDSNGDTVEVYKDFVQQSDKLILGDETDTFTLDTPNATNFIDLGTFTLNSSNQWSMTHLNLAPNTYRITELTTGYTTTYTVTGEKDGSEVDLDGGGKEFQLEAGDKATVEITNKLATTSVRVEKDWRDDGQNSNVEILKFNLYQQVTVNGVTTTVPYGSYTMSKDANGNWVTGYFTVVGTVTQRIDSGTVKSIELAKNLAGAIQFTTSDVSTVTVTFSSTGTYNTSEVALVTADGTIVGTKTVTGNDFIDVTWTDLPAGTYKITNTGTERGVKVQTITVVEGTGNPAVTYSFDARVDVTPGTDKDLIPEGTTYDVLRTLLISGLPRADADGNYYTYYVEEESLSGYRPYYSANGGDETITASDSTLTVDGSTGELMGTLTITNEIVTSIGIKKDWGSITDQTALRVELWRISSTTGFNQYEIPFDENGNVDFDALMAAGVEFVKAEYICCTNDGCGHDKCTTAKSKTFKNLPLYDYNDDGTVGEYYTYFIFEVADGYRKTYSVDTFSPGSALESSGKYTYTVTNELYTNQIDVNKQWSDGSETPVDVSLYWQIVYSCEHSYESVMTAPTCTGQGYTTHTCTECGHSYQDSYTEELGHSFGEWVTTKAATCAAEGIQTRTCSACGETETQTIPKLTADTDHSWDTGVVGDGVKTYTCTVCGATKTEEVDSSCTHTNTTTSTTDATCTTDGVTVVTCSDCGAEVSRTTIPATGHSYTDVVTAPTCVAQGYTTHTCSACGDSYTDTYISATGEHTPGEAVRENEIPATETTDGSYDSVIYCTVCNAEISREQVTIPATGSGTESKPVTVFTGAVDSAYTFASVDGDVDVTEFNSQGYFTFYYESTNQYYHNPQFVIYYTDQWNNESGIWFNLKDLSPTSTDSGYYVTCSYERIAVELSKYSAEYSDVTKLVIQGDNIKFTKITWTPAAAVQSLSLNYVSYAPVYLASGLPGLTASDGTFVSTQVVTPGVTTSWTNLPMYVLDDEGNIVGEYVYYIIETGADEFDAKYTYTVDGTEVTEDGAMTQGITGGTITVTNTQQYHYELPSTGGSGTQMYTLGGIAVLIGAAFVLMYNHKMGRKGVVIP